MCSSVSPSITVPRCWAATRSEEHTSELQSQSNLVCRLLLEKKKVLLDRKSTRLNSSHSQISYAVFCLQKKQIYEHSAINVGSPNERGPRMTKCLRIAMSIVSYD